MREKPSDFQTSLPLEPMARVYRPIGYGKEPFLPPNANVLPITTQ